MNIKDYIKNHKHINYCEAIIDIAGNIEDARPSHIEHLIRQTGLSREKIHELMPLTATPISWLVEYTQSIAIWYDYVCIPKEVSKEQLESLNLLINSKIVNKDNYLEFLKYRNI